MSGIAVSTVIDNEVWVTANVQNLNIAFVGWRYDTAAIFHKTTLLDDGQHHDGASGDGVFGAAVPAQNGTLQYYLYAENTAAGLFAPERAEHEFLTAIVAPALAGPGDVVINEFLASNITGQTDEFDQYDDWLELYNKSNQVLTLSGLYLTDKSDNPVKWQIPANVSIPANGYLIFWLDENASQGTFHTNFKLSAAGGEFLMLSDGAGLVYDSLTFGPQAPDISYGRFPNGTGPFTYMPTTFNAANSLNSATFETGKTKIRMYPNPATDQLYLESDAPLNGIELFNALGQKVLSRETKGEYSAVLDLHNIPTGLYGIKIGTNSMRLIAVQK